MDVGPSFIADLEAPVAMQPGDEALDHPAMPTQPILRFDRDPGNPVLDAATTQKGMATRVVEGLIGLQLLGPFAALAARGARRRDRVHHVLEDDRLLATGAGDPADQGEAVALGQQVVLGPRFAPINGVSAGLFAPFWARTLEASIRARLQSSWSAAPSRFNSAWCKASQTPATCQSRKRRQQVMPLPQCISAGSDSQGMPVLRTKRIPVKQARSGSRGRPPVGFGGSGGSNGSIVSHNVSLTNGFAMATPLAAHAGKDHSRVLIGAQSGLGAPSSAFVRTHSRLRVGQPSRLVDRPERSR